jgi:taurine dioxygenase
MTVTREDLTVRALQPTIGAEVSGIDLRNPISDDTRDLIKKLILQHKVLFFRDQHITRRQQSDFAARFGPLYIHPMSKGEPDTPAVHQVSADDYRIPKKSLHDAGHDTASYFAPTVRPGARPRWDGYHTDTSWRLVPTWGAVLRAVTLPDRGGDTIWADANLAYQSLEDEVKKRLERLSIVHDFRFAIYGAGFYYPVVAHPAVRTHRETGQKILWVNYSHNPSIVGLDRAEGNELLTLISDAYRKPEHQVRFSWTPGSVVFWDNRATVHYGVNNYGGAPRLLERVLIEEDEPLYADF